MKHRLCRESWPFSASAGCCGRQLFVALTLAATAFGCGSGDDDSKGVDGSTGLSSTSPEAQVYVDAHNDVRAAVTEPDGYSGTWQPLPDVAWSDEVAATAQSWANHLRDTAGCGLQHAMNTGYGENLAAGTRLNSRGAVDLWAAEKKNYTYSAKYVFSGDTGHYTQIAWRKTTHIGCASASCSGSNVIVCRYDPPGNYIGQQIF